MSARAAFHNRIGRRAFQAACGLYLFGLLGNAQAADYGKNESRSTPNQVIFEIKELRAGDAIHIILILKNIFAPPPPYDSSVSLHERGKKTMLIELSGAGTAYLDAWTLASYFESEGLPTRVPARAICENACAAAFAGGSSGGRISRSIDPTSTLTIPAIGELLKSGNADIFYALSTLFERTKFQDHVRRTILDQSCTLATRNNTEQKPFCSNALDNSIDVKEMDSDAMSRANTRCGNLFRRILCAFSG